MYQNKTKKYKSQSQRFATNFLFSPTESATFEFCAASLKMDEDSYYGTSLAVFELVLEYDFETGTSVKLFSKKQTLCLSNSCVQVSQAIIFS